MNEKIELEELWVCSMIGTKKEKSYQRYKNAKEIGTIEKLVY